MLPKLIFNIGVNGRGRIVQGCQQIAPHIPHRSAVLLKALQHIVYMRKVQRQQPLRRDRPIRSSIDPYSSFASAESFEKAGSVNNAFGIVNCQVKCNRISKWISAGVL